jgi:hypothetical protein
MEVNDATAMAGLILIVDATDEIMSLSGERKVVVEITVAFACLRTFT